MAHNKDLFRLVQALSQGERRSLRKGLSDQKLELFDCIVTLSQYDHKTISAVFPGRSPEHIAVIKKQLWNHIIEALAQSDIPHYLTSIEQSFAEINLLKRKGLYQQAYDRLLDDLRTAHDLEHAELIRRLYPLKRELEAQHPLLVKSKAADLGPHIFQAALQQSIQTAHLDELTHSAHLIRQLPPADRPAAIQHIQTQLASIGSATARRTEIQRLSLTHLLARHTADHATIRQSIDRIIHILTQHKRLLSDLTLRELFFDCAQLSIVYCIEALDFTTAEKELAKLFVLAKNQTVTPETDLNFMVRTYYISLTLALYKNQKPDGIAIIEKVLALLADNDDPLRIQTLVLTANLGIAFAFIHREFRLVTLLFRILAQFSSHGTMTKTQHISLHIYSLATCFDTENFDALEAHIPLSTNHLKKVDCWTQYETRMLSFFKDICKNTLPQNRKECLKHLAQDLNILFQDTNLWSKRDIFPVQLWIQSHLENKSLATLYAAAR